MAGWAGRGVRMIWRLNFCGFDGVDGVGSELRVVSGGRWP